MANPVELPSGKLLDLDRFIALVPNDTENKGECKLILEGYPQPIYLEQKDVFVFKEKLNQKLTRDVIQWDIEEQLRKNQPLISLIKKWLKQKSDLVSTPEDVQEYQEIQAELLKSRVR
jgi:hypothetical protein